MRVDQDRTGPLVVRRSASNERVMWITPDRVFYVGLLGAPSVRNFGAVSVYVGLDCPVSVSVDGAEWETKVAGMLFPGFLVPMGMDPACKNPARLSRMPGYYRVDTNNIQKCLYLAPEGKAVAA